VSSFERLRQEISYLPKQQVEQVYQAFEMASRAHAGQKRSSGEKYISHPLEVAILLGKKHLDYESIIAALLHDVIEDTSLDKAEIIRLYGETIGNLVDGLTKLSKISFSSAAEAQAENFRKMILAMSSDIRIILIKLADRVHNMQTLHSLPKYKQRRIAKETLDIYAPIARRLGMHGVYRELENLAFAALHPHRYEVLQKALKNLRGNRKEILTNIEHKMKEQFAANNFAGVKITGREKYIFSIYAKMVKKHLPFSEIMDIFGFRIIVKNKDDCYRALGIIHSIYKPIPGKFEDYIAMPKNNGYQSLHTTLFGPQGLPLEIQIRSEEMDLTANKGIAAHWLYKSADKADEAHIRAQQWVSNLLEMQHNTGSSIEFIESVKVDLFPHEIYVFTPRGEIIELPSGSTPVDFAYAVHSDVGDTCVSAKIDHQFAPLSTKLANGQTVTITTSPAARPNPAWLTFAKTAKARNNIRHFLRRQQNADTIVLGKQLLEHALEGLNLTLDKIKPEVLSEVLREAKLENLEALYEDIGMGIRLAVFDAHRLAKANEPEGKLTKYKTEPMYIMGTEGMAVSFADDCYPIPGDPIVGCISSGHGLIVHAETCKQIGKLRSEPDKCLLVRWAENVKGEFHALINVEMSNQVGALAELANVIAGAGSGIEDFTINKRIADQFLTTIKITVRNHDHLNQILRQISHLTFVTGASRI
jgi:guanosine-3',5'-bis(diphosphate) 3'-pyrophosphohydrolase